MSRKRKPRDSGISSQRLLVPFDCLDFGDPEKDPCFGKLYDLMDDTCLTCGDIEWCATIFNQHVVKTKRLEAENKGNDYDLKLDRMQFEKDIKDYYDKVVASGFRESRALVKTVKRFQTTKENVNKIIKNGR